MDTTLRRSAWSWFSVALIALLVLGFTAACGSDSEDDDADAAATEVTDTTTDMATAATDGEDAVATEVEEAVTEVADEVETATGGEVDAGDLGAIGTCFQTNTTADVVNDLRAGETSTAEEVYRGCLEESLPAALVSQMDPIIEQAAACGETASQDLTDEDVAAIESGDDAVIQSLTEETLTCVEDELGIPLS